MRYTFTLKNSVNSKRVSTTFTKICSLMVIWRVSRKLNFTNYNKLKKQAIDTKLVYKGIKNIWQFCNITQYDL